jgi:hypothetical protein
MDERAFDIFLDRLGDLDVETPQTKSDKGWISKELLFGFDQKMARAWMSDSHNHEHDNKHGHSHDHKSEMECLSVTLSSPNANAGVDLEKLEKLLKSAPKDEVYRIKAVLYSNGSPKATDGSVVNAANTGRSRYILNWSFGRWMWSYDEIVEADAPTLRMSIFTAQYESNKWTKKIESGQFVALDSGATDGALSVKRVQ